MKKVKLKNIIIFIFVFSAIFSAAFYAFSAEFFLSAPSTAEGRTSDFIPLLQWILKFLFFSVSILAVLMIVVGGTQYILAGASGNPENIKDAKDRILYAIGGVVLALSSWLILNTINPDLLKLDLTLPNITTSGDTGGAGEGGTGAQQYIWAKLELNQSCLDKQGEGWTTVEPFNCSEPRPPFDEANACCGFFPNNTAGASGNTNINQ